MVEAILKELTRHKIHMSDGSMTSNIETLAQIIAAYYQHAQEYTTMEKGKLTYVDLYTRDMTPCKELDTLAAYYNLEEVTEAMSPSVIKAQYRYYLPFYARFVRGVQLDDFIRMIKRYKSGNAKDSYLAKNADACLVMNDDRKAMLYFDQVGGLNDYAKLRGMDADVLRDTVLCDFGLDEKGQCVLNTGAAEILVTLQPDLTLALFDRTANKVVKSIPKKNADEAQYKEAAEIFKDMKTNIKKVTKSRADLLFSAFLNDTSFDAASWKGSYTNNPVLRQVASLIIWTQGKILFTLAGAAATDVQGKPVELTDERIRVAHPMEMSPEDVKAWREYIVSHDLKQPFLQLWEPVIPASSVTRDRYEGALLPLYRFSGQEKHGIFLDMHSDFDHRNRSNYYTGFHV